MWTNRQQKIESFFGPGVTAKIDSTEQVSARTVNCLSASSCSPGCTPLLLLTDRSSEQAVSRPQLGWSTCGWAAYAAAGCSHQIAGDAAWTP